MMHGPRSRMTGVALTLGGLVLAAAAGGDELPLDETVRAAIVEALQDEYQGESIYARVLGDHGEIRPFSRVVHAEQRHAGLLEDLLTARGLGVPESRWAQGDVPSYASVKDACVAAVDFEVRNVALYDRLLTIGPLPEDIRHTFEHNRTASLEHHKPAFERCAGRGGTPGGGTAVGREGRGGRHHGRGHRGCGLGGCGSGGCGRSGAR